MKVRGSRLVLMLGVLAIVPEVSSAQSSGGAAASPRTAAPAAVATIGPRRIDRAEFDRRAEAALREFGGRTGGNLGTEVKDLVRRQVLESQIRLNLLILEAQRLGISVPAAEAEGQLKRDPFFNPGGQFDESRFQAVKQQQPAQFAMAVNQIREQIAARKLNERIESERRPNEAEVRARARRTLVRADVAQLPLQKVDFLGSYPEPRENEILAYYARSGDEFRRPDRATLSVAFVNVPAPSDSQRALPGFMADWDRRMRRTADSLLSAIRGGVSFSEAAEAVGGPRPHVQVFRDNFPGYWVGSASQNSAIFAQKPGSVFEQVVSAREGYLLVRVDEVRPSQIAPLSEVARQIRAKLRADARANRDRNEALAIYAKLGESMRGPGWRVRMAWTDTSRISVPEPSAADLEKFYRSRLADYSSFDAQAGRIVAEPLESVRGAVRQRWVTERKAELSRTRAEQLLRAWSAGKRDGALELQMSARELPPAPEGAVLDTSAVGRAVTEGVWSPEGVKHHGSAPWEGGFVVWAVVKREENVMPTLDQVYPVLVEEGRREREAADEKGARALFDTDPSRFAQGDVMHFSRLIIEAPDILDVHLTRAEVEQYWRDHIEQYGAPELLRARHILVSPEAGDAAADAAAKAEAERVLTRLQRGEDFATLAREASDDPATRENGGDLGVFGRGTMLEPFERAAFALRPGQRTGLVKSEVGYHIIECTEHEPAVVHPLELAYTNVAADAAYEKAQRLGEARADSLLRTLRNPVDARAAATRMGVEVQPVTRKMGDIAPGPMGEYARGLEALKPGQLDRRVWKPKGQGFWIVWVDSLRPPIRPTWEEARSKALLEYRSGAGERAMRAKRDELDSLWAQGWSFDSVAVLFGGLVESKSVPPGQGLPQMGAAAEFDSLVFGGAKPAVMSPGGVSGWITTGNGLSRFRLLTRTEPPKEIIERDVDRIGREDLERNLIEYFAGLQQRFPVRILDSRLRSTIVPGPPPRR